ncbi:class IV adenylate cyclase [Desulfovibrio sulfodismutans]|uniref:Class IV adenylate cyclase n=1 Tax=Desulfolutivibrio sulfodismutans TaxID=63561 RepID=A0A7K3NMP4_9BACT|nr:class IV adenylate cyclase [Desulfolutivibrio sulfodismutans]NDY57083.1 class IV adenylate cyclase [Desulfolutivibrio sulfodismutans]QLA11712.1 CYTH domain-containing protein [Desulfolutivibrio sulfodismutans DSM 3696]
MPLEIELKFPVAGFSALRQALAEACAVPEPVVFEQNIVFDAPAPDAGPAAGTVAFGRLRAAGILLRLRRNSPGGQAAASGVVTVKLPAPGQAPAGYKVRQELETRVEDFSAMEAILHGLGYAEALRYEKVRQIWTLGGLHVCLDRLPFGRFVELEGGPDDITAWAARLGLDPASARTATYHDLHLEHLDALGLGATDSFVFAPEKSARLLAAPSLDE